MEDYQKYVGGYWDEMGKKQFDFLLDCGLKSHHKLLDIGCGSFRGGRFFIKYLNKDRYYGIEKHKWLVNKGVTEVLTRRVIKSKNPCVFVNDSFSFQLMGSLFDFALAKSVFTHLTKDKIKKCFKNLNDCLKANGKFYATFFIGNSKKNLYNDNDKKRFFYSLEEIKSMAGNSWNVEEVPEWKFGRQKMFLFTKKNKEV